MTDFASALIPLWSSGDGKIPGLRAGMIASGPAVLAKYGVCCSKMPMCNVVNVNQIDQSARCAVYSSTAHRDDEISVLEIAQIDQVRGNAKHQ